MKPRHYILIMSVFLNTYMSVFQLLLKTIYIQLTILPLLSVVTFVITSDCIQRKYLLEKKIFDLRFFSLQGISWKPLCIDLAMSEFQAVDGVLLPQHNFCLSVAAILQRRCCNSIAAYLVQAIQSVLTSQRALDQSIFGLY